MAQTFYSAFCSTILTLSSIFLNEFVKAVQIDLHYYTYDHAFLCFRLLHYHIQHKVQNLDSASCVVHVMTGEKLQ